MMRMRSRLSVYTTNNTLEMRDKPRMIERSSSSECRSSGIVIANGSSKTVFAS